MSWLSDRFKEVVHVDVDLPGWAQSVVDAVQPVTDVITGAAGAVADATSTVVDTVTSVASSVVDTVSDVVDAVVDFEKEYSLAGIIAGTSSVPGQVQDWFDGTINDVSETWDNVTDFGGNIIEWIQQHWIWIVGGAVGAVVLIVVLKAKLLKGVL